MTPVQPTDGGSAVLAPSSSSSLLASVSQTPVDGAGSALSRLDQLEAEAKALKQQALSTQESILQLETLQPQGAFPQVEFGLPVNLSGQGAAFGLGILMLAAALWWLWSRRTPVPASVPSSGFVDSSYFPLEEERIASPVKSKSALRAARHGSALVPAPVHVPEPALDAATVQNPSKGFLDRVSDIESGIEASSWYGEEDASDEFGASGRSDTFDPEVAASEVERVRKFLAEKRADRNKQRAHDADSGLHSQRGGGANASVFEVDIFADYRAEPAPDSVFGDLPQFKKSRTVQAEPTPPSNEPGFAVALASLQDAPDLGAESRRLTLELWESGGHAMTPDPEFLLNLAPPDWALSVDELDLGVTDPFELNSADAEELENVRALSSPGVQREESLVHQDEPEVADEVEFDPAVQLELAREFESLGLFQGARKLASEVNAIGNAQLRLQAQALLVKLDELELAQEQGLIPLMADQDDRLAR